MNSDQPNNSVLSSVLDFEIIYREDYARELKSCDLWIKWCEARNPPDTHGMNFHQGLRSAHVFNNIKMEQLINVLQHELRSEK